MSALESVEDLLRRVQRVRADMMRFNLSPNTRKVDRRRYSLREAGDMVGRSTQAIRDAEADGRLPLPDKDNNNRRLGFTLAEVNNMRDVFGTRLQRREGDEPVVLGCQSYKGGSGKSTTCVHLAQFLARAGLRVLLLDCDPQGSATAIFGYVPETDIRPNDTLLPFLEGEDEDLAYAVRPTYFDGLSLIPANMNLYRAEYTLAAGEQVELDRLRDGIGTIAHGFDVILIDPPPTLGMISLNALYAANAMIIPMCLGLFDFYSTVSFLQMLRETIEVMEKRVGAVSTKFIKVLMTRVADGKPVHAQMAEHLESSFGPYLLRSRMHDSAAVDNAGVMMRTVYELERDSSNRKTLDRACNLFNAVNAEILIEIRKTWPSHVRDMQERGEL